jgi:hypothetical protein
MPVRLRRSKAPDHPVTDAALDAFVAKDERALAAAIRQRPWQPSPLECDGPEPPEWASHGSGWATQWLVMWEVRQEIERKLAASRIKRTKGAEGGHEPPT